MPHKSQLAPLLHNEYIFTTIIITFRTSKMHIFVIKFSMQITRDNCYLNRKSKMLTCVLISTNSFELLSDNKFIYSLYGVYNLKNLTLNFKQYVQCTVWKAEG